MRQLIADNADNVRAFLTAHGTDAVILAGAAPLADVVVRRERTPRM